MKIEMENINRYMLENIDMLIEETAASSLSFKSIASAHGITAIAEPRILHTLMQSDIISDDTIGLIAS